MNSAVRICKRKPGSKVSPCKRDGGPIPAVTKRVEQGPSGGLFYRTKTGKKVYLRRVAGRNLKKRCREGTLSGVVSGCGKNRSMSIHEMAIYGDLPRNRVHRRLSRRRRIINKRRRR